MGKQIAQDDAMFKGEAGAAHVDLVDGTWKAARTASTSTVRRAMRTAGLDRAFTSGERKAPSPGASSDLDFCSMSQARLDESRRAEFDPLSRTQGNA